MKLDMNVLVVGSSVIDLFLSISSSHTEIQNHKVTLALGDKIPTHIKAFSLGGNGANISVGLTRLTIPTTFYTYLGKDILSREIEEKLTAEGIQLIAERGISENTPLHLIFDFAQDRIIFSHYPVSNHGFNPAKMGDVDFIFLNSIAEKWEEAYEKVLTFSEERKIPLAFSPGSRQLDGMNELVLRIIKKSQIFFSNKEEAEKILNIKSEISNTDIKNTLFKLKELGPKVVSITDAEKGAYAIDPDGEAYKIGSFDPTAQHEEKTGAGDAYAAGFFGATLLGKNVPEAMTWGAVNANAVMGKIGAQAGLLTQKEIEKLLDGKKDFQAEAL